GARGHPRRDRAHARGARNAFAARPPDAPVPPRPGGRSRRRRERARCCGAVASHGVAHYRTPGIPAIARSSKPVRPRVQARGRARRGRLRRREPAARTGLLTARRAEPARRRRADAGRGAHGRDAEGCRAVARGLARAAGRGQGGGPGGARRQPRGEHRRHPPHRVGHAPGTDPLPRFAEENMGKVTLALAAVLLVSGCGKRETGNGKGGKDLVLTNGWIVDGSGNPRYRGDVAIRGDRIVAVGFLNGAAARETLDVRGLVVAPGFIDMMGQSETYALIDNRVFSKITQGITTEVTGEGSSVAPLTDRLVMDDSDAMKKWHYREDWRDLDGYFAQLAKQGTTLNIATFVGATQVRLAVVGKDDR